MSVITWSGRCLIKRATSPFDLPARLLRAGWVVDGILLLLVEPLLGVVALGLTNESVFLQAGDRGGAQLLEPTLHPLVLERGATR